MTVSAVATATGILIFVGGFGVARYYMDHRYAHTAPMPQMYRWASTMHHERIAVAGYLTYLQYPLYGDDLFNYVQVAAQARARRRRQLRQSAARRSTGSVLLRPNRIEQGVVKAGVMTRATPHRTGGRVDEVRSCGRAPCTCREAGVIGESPRGVPVYLGFSLYRVVGRLTCSCPVPMEGV